MGGNNSYVEKKDYFSYIFKGELSEQYLERLGFDKKVMSPKIYRC